MTGSVITSYYIPKPDNNSLRRGELEARIILYFSKFSNIAFLYFITTRRLFHEPSIFLEPSKPVPSRHGHIHSPHYDEKYKQLFLLSQVPHQQDNKVAHTNASLHNREYHRPYRVSPHPAIHIFPSNGHTPGSLPQQPDNHPRYPAPLNACAPPRYFHQ